MLGISLATQSSGTATSAGSSATPRTTAWPARVRWHDHDLFRLSHLKTACHVRAHTECVSKLNESCKWAHAATIPADCKSPTVSYVFEFGFLFNQTG